MKTSPFSSLIVSLMSILLLSLIFTIDLAQGQSVDDTTSSVVPGDDSESEDSIIQKMSTGEIPKDFVRSKIDSHDVS